MGNHRFRLSDMMPNAWFYKLRDMSKLKNHNPSHPINKNLPSSIQNPRKSFYYTPDHSIRKDNNLCKNPKFFDTPFPYDPPRKSKKKPKRKTIYMPSPRKMIFQEPDDDSSPVGLNDDGDRDYFLESLSEYDDDSLEDGHDDHEAMSSSSCSKLSSSATDIIIDVDESYSTFTSINIERFTEFNMVPEPQLPPILTKPGNKEPPKLKNQSAEVPTEKVKRNPGGRKSVCRSGGVKIQGKGRRSKTGRRKSVKRGGEKKAAGLFYSESFAIVKASFDPEKDFRDSMMEMIVENNIRESKDLEELLACYLSLNSNQYHHLIIKAFEQIWFNMPTLHF